VSGVRNIFGVIDSLFKMNFKLQINAITHNPRCKELFNRLRAKGKPPKVAKVAVMRQLVRWAFAVVKSGIPYDPDYHKTTNAA
jgi:transposase